MKVLIAMDSFKGSLTSYEAGEAVKNAVLTLDNEAEVEITRIADGGEGTVDILKDYYKAEPIYINAVTPTKKPISALCYAKDELLILEVSSCIGLPLVEELDRDPMVTTSFGVGILIKNAVLKGFRQFIIGLGGSATNDAGAGMLQALGYSLLDSRGNEVGFGARGAGKVAKIDTSRVLPELEECNFTVLCDVKNPLLGKNGCTYVYSRQKGGDPAEFAKMDGHLANFAKCAKDIIPGADPTLDSSGSAGGLGFAFRTFLKARLVDGFSYINRIGALDRKIKDADIIVSGEGRLDGQSVCGKAPMNVAKIGWFYRKYVYMLCGSFGDGYEKCLPFVSDAFEISDPSLTLAQNMESENAKRNIESKALDILDEPIKAVREYEKAKEEERRAREEAEMASQAIPLDTE